MLQGKRIHLANASATKRSRSIPATMRAAAIDRFGGPDVLTMHLLPVPALDADEVLIAIDTAGVGPWDAEIREGSYLSAPPQFPLILGTDGAGIVAAVGSRMRRLRVGDKVYAYSWDNPKGGFYAEYVAVPADRVGHVPKRLDLIHADAVATTGLTALQGLDLMHITGGELLIIHGASGGVGTIAVQFAKLRGALVLATASGSDGVTLVRRLGADMAIDGRRDDLVAAARDFAPEGVDAILALAGGHVLEQAIEVLRPGGRVACPNGVEFEGGRGRDINWSFYDAISGVDEFERLNRAIDDAKLEVPIAAAFALTDAASAHARLDAGHVLGKIVLRAR